jgi:NADH dehydrogenase (ubiquinone) Fe-S protein 1
VAASRISSSQAKFVYLLNADNIKDSSIPSDAFVVYQGHHGDHGAKYADVILPGSAYTEKSATYVNTEGRAQVTTAAVPPPAGAREDWKILRALAEVSGTYLPYDDVEEVRMRLSEFSPSLRSYDSLERSSFGDLGLRQLGTSGTPLSETDLSLPIRDFYMTDPVSRSSSTMAKCSQVFYFILFYFCFELKPGCFF